MVLLISFLVGIQVLTALGGAPSPSPAPLQLPLFTPLFSLACNSSVVEAAADVALQKINADRTEGYVLSLQRIFDVRELPLLHNTSDVFFLILDVLETECHVLSRKSYKNCSIRPQHEIVHGQCKAILYINREKKTTHLDYYECVLQPIAPAVLARMCPDCPVPGDPTAHRFREAAEVSNARFNAENNHIHYFRVLNVTKGRSRWNVGPQTFVEYTIQETCCSKSVPMLDLSMCSFLPLETTEFGVCKGTVEDSRIEHRRFVTARCELYKPPIPATANPKPGKSKRYIEDERHEDGHPDHRSEKRRRHRPHHRKPHHRHHRIQSHEQQILADTFPCPPQKTVGWVMIVPPSSSHVSLHSLPPILVPTLPSLPDRPGAPEGDHDQPDKPSRANHTLCAKPGFPPFPAGFSQSNTCPGDPIIQLPGLPLPQKPVSVENARDH